MEGNNHGWYWKLGVCVLSAGALLKMAADDMQQYSSVGTIDDPAIKKASNAPVVVDSNMVHYLSRVWNSTHGDYSWCFPPPVVGQNVQTGLIYVRVPKSAATTSVGVSLQIARNIGRKKLGRRKDCTHTSNNAKVGTRERQPPYLMWTTLRDPAKRAVSAFFYYQVTRRGVEPSLENMIAVLPTFKNNQLDYITRGAKNPDDLLEMIRSHVFEPFHFIAIKERLAESLVVMKLLWGLSDADIIVMSAKRAGGYDDGRYGETCTMIQPSFTTPEIDDYLRTDFAKDNDDFLLYAAANESLDLTIAALGSLRFSEELARHQVLQKIADEACLDKTDFPCSSTGTKQVQLAAKNCLWNDAGCGYPCVEQLFKKMEGGG